MSRWPYGKALGDGDRRRPERSIEAIEELLEEPGLPGPRRRDDAHQERAPLVGHPPRDELELGEIAAPAEERHPRAACAHGGRRDDRQRADGVTLPLRRQAQLAAEGEIGGRGPGGALRGEHDPRVGELLDAGRGVHRVTDELLEGPAVLGDDLFGMA